MKQQLRIGVSDRKPTVKAAKKKDIIIRFWEKGDKKKDKYSKFKIENQALQL